MTRHGIVAALSFGLLITSYAAPALARGHHHRIHAHRAAHAHHHVRYSHHWRGHRRYAVARATMMISGIVSRATAAGTIRVAAVYAERFVGFINALVHSGYRPRSIGCYSPTGHMASSKHHWGGACDIDQTARNRTAARMYHVGALARAFGLTDGCSWRSPDCGHVEVPTQYARRSHRWHYARL